MKKPLLLMLLLITVLLIQAACSTPVMGPGEEKAALAQPMKTPASEWLEAAHRPQEHIQRNPYRHPVETLQFFDVQPHHVVVEIWPSRGWYTEILAPMLRSGEGREGQLYAAGFSVRGNKAPEWRKRMARELEDKFAQNPEVYDQVIVTALDPEGEEKIAPDGSADRVLTFRNVHNWMKGGYAGEVFNAMFRALKPGGILGVVEHRADPGTSLEDMITSGYVTEEHVISLAREAGFRLVDQSEINANPKDTKDYSKGVWTLPPTLRAGEKQRYIDIGESDRMTLKFIRPE